ncbi:MAG: hypothetical protein JWQ04_3441 [Pedosphaera sp.]|nr:hypothetical protein [Pedosphaera sp.]
MNAQNRVCRGMGREIGNVARATRPSPGPSTLNAQPSTTSGRSFSLNQPLSHSQPSTISARSFSPNLSKFARKPLSRPTFHPQKRRERRAPWWYRQVAPVAGCNLAPYLQWEAGWFLCRPSTQVQPSREWPISWPWKPHAATWIGTPQDPKLDAVSNCTRFQLARRTVPRHLDSITLSPKFSFLDSP